MDLVLSLLVGISLSATSGFRVFVPLLFLSIASLAGWVELSTSFAWIGTYPALVALVVATVLEIVAYFFPFVDNILAAAAAPVSVLAGTMITASLIVDLPPLLTWALAIAAGGGAALGGSAVSTLAHGGSTAATGGTANALLSLVESIFAFIIAALAVLVPILAFLILAVAAYLTVRFFRRLKSSPARSKGP